MEIELKSFSKIGAEVGNMVAKKNHAYGDSFAKCGQILRVLYPSRIPESSYDDLLAIVRILDKMFRIAAHKDAFGEDPWMDICGYAILSVERNQHVKKKDQDCP